MLNKEWEEKPVLTLLFFLLQMQPFSVRNQAVENLFPRSGLPKLLLQFAARARPGGGILELTPPCREKSSDRLHIAGPARTQPTRINDRNEQPVQRGCSVCHSCVLFLRKDYKQKGSLIILWVPLQRWKPETSARIWREVHNYPNCIKDPQTPSIFSSKKGPH